MKKVKVKDPLTTKSKGCTEFGEEDILDYEKRDKQYDRDEENTSY